MINIDFEDMTISKYKLIGNFNEGLAKVLNQDGLYGYINKKGDEVIPCGYQRVNDFNEGLAGVSNFTELYGFCDKFGNLVIPYKYKAVSKFKEGLAAVHHKEGLWGYIDKNGNEVIPFMFNAAYDFSEGYAVVEYKNDDKKTYAYVNKEGKIVANYDGVTNFVNGCAIVSDNKGIYTIDNQFNQKYKLKDELNNNLILYDNISGLSLCKDKNCSKYGYLDQSLNFIIPCIYYEARNFQNEVAIVELTEDTIGFVTKDGRNILFSKKNKYEEIYDFSDGLAAVKSKEGLWGYINKHGIEVIPCQYKSANSFSKKLAGVLKNDGTYVYINKKGKEIIILPNIYKSTLKIEDKEIEISANTLADLKMKKIKVLKQVQQELNNDIISSIKKCSNDIINDSENTTHKIKVKSILNTK